MSQRAIERILKGWIEDAELEMSAEATARAARMRAMLATLTGAG